MNFILIIVLTFFYGMACADDLKELTHSLDGTEITYNYTSGRSYNVAFSPKGVSYRYLTGAKPEKWWGPFPYEAFEVKDNVFFASWFEKGYGDYVTLLINFNNDLLYGSAILRGETVHFHGAKLVKSNYLMNQIVPLILKDGLKNNEYTVVNELTRLSDEDFEDEKSIALSKKYINEYFKHHGFDFSKLVDKLYEVNKVQMNLTISSNIPEGYLIDKENIYDKYFEKDGGGWELWYKEHPNARGKTTISIPVYDKVNGIVLVYKGSQFHWKSGKGKIIAYRYENGTLVELVSVRIWIS